MIMHVRYQHDSHKLTLSAGWMDSAGPCPIPNHILFFQILVLHVHRSVSDCIASDTRYHIRAFHSRGTEVCPVPPGSLVNALSTDSRV